MTKSPPLNNDRIQAELKLRRALMIGGEERMWAALDELKTRPDHASLQKIAARWAARNRSIIKRKTRGAR